MQAIVVRRFGGPEVLGLEDMDDPIPGPEQVVVGVAAAGVNPVDTYIRSGTYGSREFPFIPGYDAAGIVLGRGPGPCPTRRAGWTPSIGERVFVCRSVTGTYATRCLCHGTQVYPLPERVSFEQGAAVFVPYATAWCGLQRAGARPGETVLVHGASGGVGLAAVQIARAMGMTVIGTASTEPGRALVLQQGAHHAIAHASAGGAEPIRQLTAGRGPDVILEMLANVNLAIDLDLIAPRGRIVVIGNRGEITINPRLSMTREASILGMSLHNATEHDLAEALAGIHAGLDDGRFTPVIGSVFPLADASRAQAQVIAHDGGSRGKIVLRVGGER